MMTNGQHWTVFYTRPRHEKKVYEQLIEKKINCYLPMRKVLRQWSDRKKWIDEPLFRSYIFVHGDERLKHQALQTRGVVRAVLFQGRLAIVRDEEIEMIRRILRESDKVEAIPRIEVGDEVELMAGPLIGLRGRLESLQNEHRLVIDIPSIRQAIRITVDIRDVRKVR
jgi:transcriptional antiterminator RfaH